MDSDELSSNNNIVIKQSSNSELSRLKQPVFIVVYLSLIILGILLLVVVYFGLKTDWNNRLIPSDVNPWIVRILWVFATIASYLAYHFIVENINEHPIPRDLIVSVLYIISSFLFLAWAITYYYAEDIVLSLWILFAVFVYNVWLFIYVWRLTELGAAFLVPNLILYVYLLYSTLHIASINNIPI